MSQLHRRYYPKLREEIYSAILANGLSVFIIPKRGFREKVAFFSTNYGSIDTDLSIDGKLTTYPSGIAHFLEHKLFEDEDGRDITLDFVRLGAEANACTTLDRTTFYFSTLENFEQALQVLHQMTSTLTVTNESLTREKSIIKQEINMYQDDPDYMSYLGCLKGLYPGTALSDDIAGSDESVDLISDKMLQENFTHYYNPRNSRLVLVGDFDVDEVYNSVKELYGLTSQEKEEFSGEQSQPIQANIGPSDSVQMEVTVPKLAIGFKSLPFSDNLMRERLLTQIFFNLLFGWTSPYYQTWYSEGKIDDSLSIECEVSKRYSFVILTMDTAEPIRMSSLIQQVVKSKDKRKIFNERAFQLQKRSLYSDFLRSFDDLQQLGDQFLAFLEDEKNYFDLDKELSSIELEEVKRFAKHYIRNMELTDFVVFPK